MSGALALPGRDLLRAPAPAAEPCGGAEQSLVCKRVHDVTHDVKTFVFEPAEPGLFRHDPGQYLAFTFDIDGREATRCYTISSPPSRPHLAAITVKRVPGGLVSNWLHEHLSSGDTVRARGPLGRFSTARHPAPAYLFLSAGSGITPLMSMVRTLYDLASPADVVFVHSARSPDDIPFRQELELIAATAPDIRVTHVCEEDGAREVWGGHRGRLGPDVLRRAAPDLLRREVFCCGPPGYMDAVRRMLAGAGLPPERYHEESFEATGLARAPVPEGAAPPASPASPVPDGPFAVRLARSGTTVECDAGTPVLLAAARAGVTLPSSCGEGVCGTCVATLEKGRVDMRHNGGLRPRDAARDKILLCCSTPLEDLVIDA